jgi:hypothetical protein
LLCFCDDGLFGLVSAREPTASNVLDPRGGRYGLRRLSHGGVVLAQATRGFTLMPLGPLQIDRAGAPRDETLALRRQDGLRCLGRCGTLGCDLRLVLLGGPQGFGCARPLLRPEQHRCFPNSSQQIE